ncbi:MAG: hypothetical protein VX949_11360 [Planctomycetota bacterium]|nr:hypothetical protein [Planctomycetota bacterium]
MDSSRSPSQKQGTMTAPSLLGGEILVSNDRIQGTDRRLRGQCSSVVRVVWMAWNWKA